MSLIVVAAAATFNRPGDTTAYQDTDLVANSTTAGSVTPFSFSVPRNISAPLRITRVLLTKTTATVANTSFRIHFFTASPTSANGDNSAFASGTAASYLNYIAISSCVGMASGAAGWGAAVAGAEPTAIITGAAATTLYALIEAKAAYAPGNAETFGASIEVQIDEPDRFR